MKTVLIAFFVGLVQVSAFLAPRTQSTRSSAIAMVDVKELPGISQPLGFFDPFGLSKTSDKILLKYRESELKHGRVAMIAVLGWLAQEKWHPIYDGKLSSNPLQAWSEIPGTGAWQILAFAGFIEFIQYRVSLSSGYRPGDILGVGSLYPDEKAEGWVGLQTRELNNGRLAMFAILGEITHSLLTGKGALEQIGF